MTLTEFLLHDSMVQLVLLAWAYWLLLTIEAPNDHRRRRLILISSLIVLNIMAIGAIGLWP